MAPIRLKSVPTLRIGDVGIAQQFYCEFLGFTLDWQHYYAEGAPVYMQVARDGMVLHLSENERFKEQVIVFVETQGIDQLREELVAKAGRWTIPAVTATPWHTRQMEIEDPFGNLLRFNEVVEPPPKESNR